MNNVMYRLAREIETINHTPTEIISWAMPVPVFGNHRLSKIATVGLNPSNLEFQDLGGTELRDENRRFQTLNSLRIDSWDDVRPEDIESMSIACRDYFTENPYCRWFNKLDNIIGSLKASYSGGSMTHGCHLDLVPFATHKKWGSLSQKVKNHLLESSCDSLMSIIGESNIQVLLLNGISVVNAFKNMTGANFKVDTKYNWRLPRKNGRYVEGYSFVGELTFKDEKDKSRKILVLGYNHNIQSSFGVTRKVQQSIRAWIKREVERNIELSI